jgi:ketosteroid isomerase-like protein
MKKLAVAALFVFGCTAVVSARPQAAPAAAPAKMSVSATVKQIEQDWADAGKAGDAAKLGTILADDWVAIEPDGKMVKKAEALADLKAGKSKLDSLEFGPMDVKVIGKVAIVQGTDTEKSMMGGKDTSGKYAWMDVFENIDGKWQAVRSEVTMVKMAK